MIFLFFVKSLSDKKDKKTEFINNFPGKDSNNNKRLNNNQSNYQIFQVFEILVTLEVLQKLSRKLIHLNFCDKRS